MEDLIDPSGSSATRTQPVKVNLRSYVMRMLEKERIAPAVPPAPEPTPPEPTDPVTAWRKQKFGGLAPGI